MIEQVLSAGVYSSENDQSYVAPGQSQTGLAVVGPTEKGEAFVPTDISSYSQFVARFGAGNDSYVPQTVFSYLQAGNNVKVTRVLGNGGWSFDGGAKKLAAIVSGSKIVTVFHPSKNDSPSAASLNASTATGTYNSFLLTLSGSGVSKQISSSLSTSATNYLTKVVGTDENFQTGSGFPYLVFPEYITALVNGASNVSLITSSNACTFTSSKAEGYDNAKTPWVLSEGGVRLFRIHHRSHGTKTNKDVKVAIANISVPTDTTLYTTFDIIIRQWNDTDSNPSILEQYSAVSINPNAPNYIGYVIGDKFREYNASLGKVVEQGDYTNISNFIRIELSEAVINASLPPSVKPNGFEALYQTIAGFSGSFSLPSASYVYNTSSAATSYSGFNYSSLDNINYLNPVPSEAVTGSNVNFAVTGSENKFMIPFQGGLDGMNIATIKKIGADIKSDGTNVFGFDLSSANTGGTSAYQKAFNILSNDEEYSFNVLAVPGVIEQYHSVVTALAENLCEERTDAIYIRDLAGLNSSVSTAAALTSGINSSYCSTYFPWVKVKSLTANKDIFVPPSVLVPQALAYNDRIGAEWFAPAGLNRGGLGGAIDTKIRLSKSDRDTLYSARINPITKFPNTGVVIYGQKTLQVADTALNRVNVRRLLISLRGYIGDISKSLVFDQNTIQLRNKFLSIVNPYLENVQTRQGLYAFRIVMDETNNTADVIDRLQLMGKIYLQPTRAAEYIILEYNIQPTGATFA